MPKIYPCLLYFFTLFEFAQRFHCSHFRGGTINWKPVNSSADPFNNNVDIFVTTRFYWRLDYEYDAYCDQSTIANNGLIGNFDYIECISGCSSNTLLFTQVICTDFSSYENWKGGERTQQLNLPYDSRIVASYSSGDWITLLNGGGSWQVNFLLDLNKRNDTGKINSSPITTMSPIVRLNQACNSSIRIPVEDADKDLIKCRWAISGECGGVCGALPDSYLDSDNCVLFFKPPQTGFYGVTIQIEDFPKSTISNNNSFPLSSVPLQFLILSNTGNSQNCTSDQPFIYFHQDTLQDQSCIAVPLNSTFSETIIVYSISDVIEITTQSPYGFSKSNIFKYDNEENLWYVNVTWTPTDGQSIEIFCFKATNKLNYATPNYCVTLVVGAHAVSFYDPIPSGLVFPNQTSVLRIKSDKFILKSPRVSTVKFYDSLSNLIETIFSNSSNLVIDKDNRSLTIYPTYVFKEKLIYYIKFNRGVAISDEYCGLDSNKIIDESFWRFRVRDITPPVVNFLMPSLGTSNSSVKIEWSVNEEAYLSCSLNTPTSVVMADCNTSIGKFLL